MTETRWYVIGKNGVARPAESERQAILDKQDADHFFPKYAPHRAVQLVDAAKCDKAARLSERERCAKICEEQALLPECPERAQYCADAIRGLLDD